MNSVNMKTMFSVFIFSAAILLITSAESDQITSKLEKPEGYVQIGDKDYYISSSAFKLPADDAFSACSQLRNKTLVSFETEAEFIAVHKYLNDNALANNDYWTSGHYWNKKFIWIGSGTFVTEIKWEPGQPNDQGICSCIYLRGAYQGLIDTSCSFEAAYICE